MFGEPGSTMNIVTHSWGNSWFFHQKLMEDYNQQYNYTSSIVQFIPSQTTERKC